MLLLRELLCWSELFVRQLLRPSQIARAHGSTTDVDESRTYVADTPSFKQLCSSVVGKVATLRVRFPAMAGDSSPLENVQTFRSHLAYYSMGTEGHFPGGQETGT